MRLFALVAFAASLLVAHEPVMATPTVFWASDPVGPDETVLVVGDGLGQVGTVRVWRLADSPEIAAPPAQGVDVVPVQVSNESLKFTIPKEMAQGVFRIALGSDGAVSFDLNAPTVYWTQGDLGSASSPDGWLRVFGRNIARTVETVIRLKPTKGLGNEITLRASATSIWDATFKIPLNLPTGAYSARLWNGQGDADGWRDLGMWRVEAKSAWPQLILNAKAFGATADGSHDDTSALSGALQVLANKGGGTLFLPRGYYRVSGKLTLPPNTRLRGEDRTLVRLIWPDLLTPPLALLEGSSDFAIEDVTLVASNHAHIISGGFSSGPDDRAAEPQNITLRNITVRASMYRGHLTPDQVGDRLKAALKFSTGGPDTVRLRGRDIVVENCDLYGSGRSLYLERPRSARVAHNKLYNGRWGWYSVSGADGVIFEDNDVMGADLQSTGGGINTLGKLEMFAQNVAFLHNRFAMMTGWDQEAVTSDGPGGCYYGAVSSVTSDRRSLTLAVPAESGVPNLERCVGAGFFVLDGRGMGQVHRVSAVEGSEVKLETPLLSSFNERTIVSVTSLQRNYLVVGNEFSDAGIAVQLFGASVNEIIADNVSRRTAGFLNRGLFYRQYQPTWYTQFIGNRIAEGDLTKDSILATWGSQKPPNKAPLSFATIMRANRLDQGAHIETRGYARDAPGVRDVIVEGNSIAKSSSPIVIDAGSVGVLTRNNSIDGHVSKEALSP